MSWRPEVLRAASLGLLAAALVLRRSEREVVRLLRNQVPLEQLNPVRRWALRRLVRNGAATLLDQGRYALIPDGYASYRSRRRVRAFVVISLLALALLVLWRAGKL